MSDTYESTGRRPPGQWRDQPMRGSSGGGNQWSESGEQTWRKPKCYHCGRLGHTESQCYQKQRYGDYGSGGGHKWRSGQQYGRRSGPKKQWSDRRSSKSASADGVSAEVNHFPQLSDFYLNRRLSDVTFVCDGQSLFAHRFVVSAKSQVFKEMLFPSTAECDSKTDNELTANPETKASEEMVTESQSTAGEEMVVDNESKVDEEMTTECQTTVGEEIAIESESKTGEELAVDSESKVGEEVTTECQPTVGEEIVVESESISDEELAVNNESNTGDQMVVDNQSKTGEDAAVDMELKPDEEMADKSQLKTNEETDVNNQSKPTEEMVTECQSAVGEEITDGSDSKAAENDEESKKGEDAAIDVVKTCPAVDLIHISDTNVEAFKLLLKFLYCEEFADEMSADPVMAGELLKLAIRFKVDPLATFLQSKTTE